MKHSADEDTATETDLDTPIPYSIASRDNRLTQDITEQLREAHYLVKHALELPPRASNARDAILLNALSILDRIILE